MKFTLIQLPFPYYDLEEGLTLPIGLLALATYAEKRGHIPILIDLDYPLRKRELTYSKDFFRSAAKYIIKKGANFLGFSILASTLPAALLIAKECKILDPHCYIVFGGPDASFEDIALMKAFGQVDAVVRGEGEETLAQLLRSRESGQGLDQVKGLTYRMNGQIIRNEPRPFISEVDSLPYLNYNLLPHLGEYKRGAMEGGRGCPYCCIFCSTSKMWGRKYRIKSPQRLADELAHVSRVFKPNDKLAISIIHDNFLVNKIAINSFLDLIADRGIPWSCSTRLDHLDRNLIGKLARAGCQILFIGIESGSTRMQKKIHKYLPLDGLFPTLYDLSMKNIGVILSFIIGLPGETRSDMNQTLLYALRSALFDYIRRVQIQPSTVLKGSDLYQDVKTSLCKRKAAATVFSPFLTNLQSERRLVRMHPNIFPSYYPKYDSFKSDKLHTICDLYNFLAGASPATTLLLLKYFKLSPLRLAEQIFPRFKGLHVDWSKPAKAKTAVFSFLSLFKRFLKGLKLNELILEVAAHEEVFLRTWLSKSPVPTHIADIDLSFRPQKNPNMKIRSYRYNIPQIYKLMSNTKSRDFTLLKEGVPVTLAYVPGKLTRVIQIGPIARKLLSQCDGKTSLQKIFDHNYGIKERTNEAKSLLIDKYKYLQDQGLICLL